MRLDECQFWCWFASNAQRLRHALSEAQEPDEIFPVVESIRQQLQLYDHRLHPVIGLGEDDQPELIITAEGDAHAFRSVFELMKAAPKLDDWRVIPLKPRMGSCDGFRSIEIDGAELNIDETRFVMATSGARIELAILVVDHTDDQAESYRFMALALVECLIGERDLATRIECLDVVRLSDFERVTGHDGWPIRDLAAALPPVILH
ncbi:MAG: hypothetical protein R3D57_03600 [Hyphomicrobiaceae bacterium]